MGGAVTEIFLELLTILGLVRSVSYLSDNMGSFSELKVILVMVMLTLLLILLRGPMSSFLRTTRGVRVRSQRNSLAVVVTHTNLWPQGETVSR